MEHWLIVCWSRRNIIVIDRILNEFLGEQDCYWMDNIVSVLNITWEGVRGDILKG